MDDALDVEADDEADVLPASRSKKRLDRVDMLADDECDG